MFFESSTCSWAEQQLQYSPSKQRELSENMLQNLGMQGDGVLCIRGVRFRSRIFSLLAIPDPDSDQLKIGIITHLLSHTQAATAYNYNFGRSNGYASSSAYDPWASVGMADADWGWRKRNGGDSLVAPAAVTIAEDEVGNGRFRSRDS